jgi:hypothetical protein
VVSGGRIKEGLTMKGEKKIRESIILVGFIFFLIPSFSFGISWFEKEKEVADEYLTKLFAPEFPYESIKVVEDSKARRFIVIKTKEKIAGGALREYNNLLLSRGVNIYGTFHYGMFSWQKRTTSDYAITLTRKVKGEPDSVEISKSVVKDPVRNEPIVAATAKGKEIRIAIEKDFGKGWREIRIIPDKELKEPEPKIGRYPGSRLFKVNVYGEARIPVFVSKDSLEQVYYYYEEKVKKSFETVYDFPFAHEMFENPRAYSHNSIEVFGIKTIGRDFWIRGRNHPVGEKWNSVEIKGYQSLDPNLSKFIQIAIFEWREK